MKIKNIVMAAVIGMSIAGSAGAGTGAVVVDGSSTLLPVAQAAAEAYMDKNPGIKINVRGGGSGIGIASLQDSTCDIANSSRAIKASEISLALKKGLDPKATVIALDGIAVIVNKMNYISGLTKKQVKGIYTGSISDWSQVGGTAGKIVVVSRDTSSGTYEAFGALAMDGGKMRPDALLQAASQAVATTVSKTPGAIGYVGIGYINDTVKALNINEVECKKDTVWSNTYPYSRPLFMYTSGKPKGESKKFIDFILSADGQKIVEDQGFVPLRKLK
ncbi:MAG: phosphate ABC transporter substrate-binding protein [Candidatus Firestonebacteria bacterium]|nr:phosphate ABC transporter substrate-binding protein [Candidatus Firestonebacteria bacterium]